MGILAPLEIKRRLNQAIDEEINSYKADNCINNTFIRERKLPLKTMVRILLSMGGGNIAQELEKLNIHATKAAFSQRRKKISAQLFEDIFERSNGMCEDIDTQTYKGYRVFAVDGTAVNAATNPDTDSYMLNGKRKGCNQLHANILFDVCNNTYQHCLIQPQPQADEIGALYSMLSKYSYPEKTLIIADMGYEAYNVFAYFKERTHTDFLIRIRQNRSAMREIHKLPREELDRDISFTLTTTQTNADKENGYIYIQTARKPAEAYSAKTRMRRWEFGSPYHMTLRIVRIQLSKGKYETFATSLPRSITAAEIKELYHARWKIETSFRDLKYAIGLEHLHGRSDEFAKQEIFAALTMANFCGRISQFAVIDKQTDRRLTYAVSRKMAIVLCRKYFATDNADDNELLEKISSYTEAVRPDRKNTRNVRIKSFSGFTYRIPS